MPLDFPVYMTGAPGRDMRLFVVEKNTGLVRVIENNILLDAPLLDINADLAPTEKVENVEQNGLLSIAFHPDFESNHRMFAAFSASPIQSGFPISTVVFEYTVIGTVATFTGEIFREDQTEQIHGSGALRFLPDGSLLFGVGDGNISASAQDVHDPRGKIHRLLTDEPGFTTWLPGNPIPSSTVWAWGVRNPYSFAVDKQHVWVADVGDMTQEEVSRIKIEDSKVNFEWDCMEGTAPGPAPGTCTSIGTLTGPVFTFPHSSGNAIIGGPVNDGELRIGVKYLFGEFSDGSISAIDTLTPTVAQSLNLFVGGPDILSGFGSDNGGGSYVVTGAPSATPAKIYKIIEKCDGLDVTTCTANPNSTGLRGELCASDLASGNLGEARIVADELRFIARNVPNGEVATLYVNTAFLQPPMGFFAGIDCIGVDPLSVPHAAIVSTGVMTRNNQAVFDVSAPTLPGVGVNVTLYFQVLFTDGGTLNCTDATRLLFQ